MTQSTHAPVLIVGSGPAGLTAAIYAARAKLSPLLVSGYEPGGQLTTTTEVENFPGFPEGIQGPQLMEQMRKQAERFGARFMESAVDSVDLTDRPFKLETDEGTVTGDALIIATGASARYLNVPGEKDLKGFGVSSCATCDGFFFNGKEVVVVGGGDSAMEEATFLTRFASKVTIIHRRKELRASRIMQERARHNPRIEFLLDTVVDGVLGNRHTGLTGLKVRNVLNGESRELPCDGMFVAIGHDPNTGWLKGQVNTDPQGYILTTPGTTLTSVEGVFAAGDVHDKRYRQAITAAGSGCQAALDAQHWLESVED